MQQYLTILNNETTKKTNKTKYRSEWKQTNEIQEKRITTHHKYKQKLRTKAALHFVNWKQITWLCLQQFLRRTLTIKAHVAGQLLLESSALGKGQKTLSHLVSLQAKQKLRVFHRSKDYVVPNKRDSEWSTLFQWSLNDFAHCGQPFLQAWTTFPSGVDTLSFRRGQPFFQAWTCCISARNAHLSIHKYCVHAFHFSSVYEWTKLHHNLKIFQCSFSYESDNFVPRKLLNANAARSPSILIVHRILYNDRWTNMECKVYIDCYYVSKPFELISFFPGNCFCTLRTGGHLQPPPSLTKKYYCTSW